MKFPKGVQILGKTLLPVAAFFLIILTPVIRTSPILDQLILNSSAALEWMPVSAHNKDTSLRFDTYDFGNPAGCSPIAAADIPVEKRLADAQQALGDALNLEEARQSYIWNGPNHLMTNVMEDGFAFEFSVDAFRPPYTYKADQAPQFF